MDHDSREDGRCKRVSRHAGADWIESHRTQHVPGRHLSSVIVTRQTSGASMKLVRQNVANAGLSLPSGASIVVEVSDAVARLVALVVQLRGEETVEFGDKGCVATDCLD